MKYSTCPVCKNPNIHVHDGRLVDHYVALRGLPCAGSNKAAAEIRLKLIKGPRSQAETDAEEKLRAREKELEEDMKPKPYTPEYYVWGEGRP